MSGMTESGIVVILPLTETSKRDETNQTDGENELDMHSRLSVCV